MEIKELIKKVEESEPFKQWSKTNEGKLAHIFSIEGGVEAYDIGYYLEKEDKIASFEISNDNVIFKGTSEAFKQPNKKILPLDKEKIKVNLKDALEKVLNLQKEKYASAIPFKQITILQKLPEGQVWNFTFITQTFKTLNIKIDSETGEILSDEIVNLIQEK